MVDMSSNFEMLRLLLKTASLAVAALLSMAILAQAEPPAYRQFRYDEDYTYLRDPTKRTDFFDPVKYIELDDLGLWYLSLGGTMRQRYEMYHNPMWGQGPQDKDGYSLQRYMFHGDLHYEDLFRLFTEFESVLEYGREGGPRPTDKDEFDIHQLFTDVKVPAGNSGALIARIGRQEMDYGSSRLISVREGPNARRSFDAARGIYQDGGQRTDIFFAKPVETNPWVFDDWLDPNVKLWGLYDVTPLSFFSGGNIDLYYLGIERGEATFNQGTARELRHSFGTRLWGKRGSWDYNYEFVGQSGQFDGGSIAAWTAASETGYTFKSAAWKPRPGIRANITSGDRDPDNKDLQTFNPLYPKGAYFSEAALIGPANHIDVHPFLDLRPSEKILVTVDWDCFWRESVHDGIYGFAVNLERPADSTSARYVGNQPEIVFQYLINRHFTFFANYAHFFAGPFLKDTGPGKDVDYVTVWLSLKF